MDKEYSRLEIKLANENYLAKAPKDIVVRDKKWLEETKDHMAKIKQQIQELKRI